MHSIAPLPGELKAFATHDAFVDAHSHALGDIAVWTAAATPHKAEAIAAATGPGGSRLLTRISLKGRPPPA